MYPSHASLPLERIERMFNGGVSLRCGSCFEHAPRTKDAHYVCVNPNCGSYGIMFTRHW